MDNKFYDDLESVFSTLIQLLNNFNQSEVLQNFFIDMFVTFFYSNLIANFFSNLTDENIKECGLPVEEIDNIKNEFRKIRKDIKFDPSKPMERQIDQDYYNNFKVEIEKKFPKILKLIIEMEKLIDTDKAKKYLQNKSDEIKLSGKSTDTIEFSVITKAMEIFVKKNKFFPDLDDPKFEKVLKKISKEHVIDSFGMGITDWDIWHSYSSYFIEGVHNLEEIAIRLVEEGLCPLVFSSKTEYWYKKDDQIKRSNLEIKNLSRTKFHYEAQDIVNNYSGEILGQAAQMWYAEWRLFSELYRESFPYIKGFLNVCYLKKGPRTIALYPQIKIYKNGTFSLIFREISPSNFTYRLEPFIENEVNLPQLDLDNIQIPPELIELNSKRYLSTLPVSWKLFQRDYVKKGKKEIKKLLEENKELIDDGDFKFHVVPFKLDETKEKLYLGDLCEIIVSTLTYIEAVS